MLPSHSGQGSGDAVVGKAEVQRKEGLGDAGRSHTQCVVAKRPGGA